MGLFDAFENSYTEVKENYNEFVSQYINAKLNGTESYIECLYRVVSEYTGIDRLELRPDMKLEDDLCIDPGYHLPEVFNRLKERIIFKSKNNSFYDWYYSLDDKFADPKIGEYYYLQTCNMTLGQLENIIADASPRYAAIVK